jgi:hypothetical protein
MASGFNFDANRWTRAEQITGIASFLLLISLFLPWFTASVSDSVLGHDISESASVSGTGAHHYLWIVAILAIVVVIFVVMQAGFATPPFNLPVAPAQLLLGLTGLNLLLVLIAFIFKPGTGGEGVGFHVSVGWGFGAFVGLICAIAAFVPLVLPMARARAAA